VFSNIPMICHKSRLEMATWQENNKEYFKNNLSMWQYKVEDQSFIFTKEKTYLLNRICEEKSVKRQLVVSLGCEKQIAGGNWHVSFCRHFDKRQFDSYTIWKKNPYWSKSIL